MFKLKKGNVIEKLNSMDRKQMYTYGGVVIAVVVALFLIASFLGNAEDPSFEGFSSRGYDLANSPFVTDEAEEYLLAAKYPDMQEQPSNFLYSEEEKEARQAEDAQEMEEQEMFDDEEETYSSSGSKSSSSSSSSSSSGSRAYRGYKGSGGSRQPTTINSLGTAQRTQAGGHGVNSSWGGPRVDTNPYKQRDVDTGKSKTQKEQTPDAKRALSQFSQGARLAAGMKDNRALNMKRAVMGADSSTGAVDLSEVTDSSQLDTYAPQNETPDLQSLQKEVEDTAEAANNEKDEDKEPKEGFWAQLGKQLLDIGLKLGEHMLTQWLDDKWADRREASQWTTMANQLVHNKDWLKNNGYPENITAKQLAAQMQYKDKINRATYIPPWMYTNNGIDNTGKPVGEQ